MQTQTQTQQMEPVPADAAPAPVLPQGAASQPPPLQRKRKAETQDNERLSKRLSLLNLGMHYSELLCALVHLSYFHIFSSSASSSVLGSQNIANLHQSPPVPSSMSPSQHHPSPSRRREAPRHLIPCN